MKCKLRVISIIAMILAMLLFLEVPVGAVAPVLADDNISSDITVNKVTSLEEENIEGNILGEVNEERTEYSKTFMLDDGTFMVAQYDVPVHYEDGKGNFVEYNNTLVNEATADEATAEDELTNKSSDINVRLSKKAKAKNMVKVSSSEYSISWGYDDAKKVEAKLIDNDSELSGNDKFTTLSNLSSEIIYENVFDNVDFQYIVTTSGVKENIILKSSDVPDEFNITYKVNKLTAKQTDDYCISLYDKSGEEVYSILAPYMVDAKGKTSTKIKLELVSQKGANLKVKLILDKSFIRSLWRSFPITVDPEITTHLINDKISLLNCTDGAAVNYGPYTMSANSFTILSFNELPELKDGERIVSAKLNLETSNGSSALVDSDDYVIVNLHKAKHLSGNLNTYEDEVLDYDSLSYEDNTCLEFDITRLFKEWYVNGDEGDAVVFEAEDTIESKTINIQRPTQSSNKPSLTYIYKDFTGMESNLSYHTFDAGHKATASVSDYLGNLILTQTVFEGTGSRMPFSVYLTYNSINYDKKFENGSPSGLGWQFSFNQYIRETTGILAEQGYNYIYTDSDGTDHYLKKDSDSEEWYDEDGIGFTLTKDETALYLDNGSVIQTYQLPSNGGKLLLEKDEYNNTLTYTYYEDGNLKSVEDGAGRTTNIYYNTNSNNESRVSKIQSPGNKYLFFYYTADDKIDYVRFSNAMQTRFEYGSNGRVVKVIDEYIAPPTPGKMVSFAYDSNARVNKITETGTDGSEGNYLDIEYNDDNTTVFTDRKGRSATYTFNDNGELVSTLNSNGYVSGGDTSGLSLSGGAESFTKNYIRQLTENDSIGSNSTSYYFKVNGHRDDVYSSGGTCSVDTSSPDGENGKVQFIGSTSLKINNPKNASNSAFFTCIRHDEDAALFVGKDVTFSAYAKTKDVEEIYSGGAVGAALRIVCYNSKGKAISGTSLYSVGVTGTEDWQRLSVTVSVPSNTDHFKLYCVLRSASGTAWFDCIQLEEGSTASDYNALQNSDFVDDDQWKTREGEDISPQNGTVILEGVPEVYNNSDEYTDVEEPDSEEIITGATYTETSTETEPYGVVTTYDDFGNEIKTEQGAIIREVTKTYKVKSDSDIADTGASEDETEETTLGNRYIYQSVEVDRAGVIFNISGEAQANSVPLTNENRTFGIALVIHYDDEATLPEMHYQEFNAYTDCKQAVSMSAYPFEDNKVIDYVDFAFVYSYNENAMVVSNAMLNIALSSYSDVEDTEEETGSTEAEDDLIDYEINSESVDKSNTYMQTSTAYDSTSNYVMSETDEAGNTITYTYDNYGNVSSITDAMGNTTNYTYNADDNITRISSGEALNTYSYNVGGNVTYISHNDFTYRFTYDVFDNIIASKIGNTTVSTNTYSANNGNLLRTDYANGDYIEYTYDSYDNLIQLTGETGEIAKFVYNKKGLIGKYIDVLNNTTTYYYYDFEGNLTGEYRQSDSGALSYYKSIDSDGNQVEKTAVNGQTKIITSGTDSDGDSFTSYDGVTVSSTSDDFGRTTRVETSRSGEENSFITRYDYAHGAETNSTTNLVSLLIQQYGDDELLNYRYTYNANGDITEVYDNNTRVAVYNYDSLNQLTWYGDINTGLYKCFTYDNAGNILKVSEYELITNGWRPGALIAEYTYSYDDTNWKDKLTSFNGDDITYDANGNPLTYRDGMTFTWVNGRVLDTITQDDTTIAMKYDSNGLRTQKGDTKYYYDSNSNLIGMVKGSNTLLFYYDESGSPTSFTHNGTMYYYVKNLQGDIVKIVNQNGSVVANYTYDALGKKLDVTNSSGASIGSSDNVALLNPLRYRGYVYDEETGLYYLQSRYYDPLTGRFLNADALLDTGSGTPLSTNAFAYCENNSISYLDFTGMAAISAAKTTPLVIRNSIQNSGLDEKFDSIDDTKIYDSKKFSNGIIIYSFTKLLSDKQFQKSTYYLMKKTRNGWIEYANNRWWVKIHFVKAVGFFCEIFSFYENPENPSLQLIGTLGSHFASKYVPKGVNTILNQLVSSNYYNSKYYICFKVINRYYAKNKKGWYCFHEKSYSLW